MYAKLLEVHGFLHLFNIMIFPSIKSGVVDSVDDVFVAIYSAFFLQHM